MFKSKAENFVMFFESYGSLELSHQSKAENFVRFFFESYESLEVYTNVPFMRVWSLPTNPSHQCSNQKLKTL